MRPSASDFWPGFDESRPSDHGTETHPLIKNIRAVVHEYSIQSAAHYAWRIRVHALGEWAALEPGRKLRVGFHTHAHQVYVEMTCRPSLRKGKVTNAVEVRLNKNHGHWESLEKRLAREFPPNPARVIFDTMSEWWSVTGKTFNWAGLPTELKENVLQNCVQFPQEIPQYWPAIPYCKRLKVTSRSGPHEVFDQLGDWQSVLRVDRQTRTLALRLLLARNNHYSGGLTIIVGSCREFRSTMGRLASPYQLNQEDSMPVGQREKALAKLYLDFPLQHPHLNRFATMRHGIRKLYLNFDWIDALHFFKVTVGNIDRYRGRRFKTCDFLLSLPNLDRITFCLPGEWLKQGWGPSGPPGGLFHETRPCPRTLHRFIYERAAVELAVYKNVQLVGFMGKAEGTRFQDLRETAMLRQKLRLSDLEDLYAECGGGIQLETNLDDGPDLISWETTPFDSRYQRRSDEIYRIPEEDERPDADADSVFPPECYCEIPCSEEFWKLTEDRYADVFGQSDDFSQPDDY